MLLTEDMQDGAVPKVWPSQSVRRRATAGRDRALLGRRLGRRTPGGEQMAADFDLVVIGGGPGGYVAAIRAASWA